MHDSQGLAAIIMIGYLAAAGNAFYMLYNMYCVDKHGLMCFVGTTMIGVGMLIFRLLRGMCTRQVKQFHMLIQMTGAGLIFLGIQASVGVEPNSPVHSKPAFIIFLMMVAQVLLALLIFMGSTTLRTRLKYAPVHDILGIWIYLCLVGCCLAGTLESAELKTSNWNRLFYASIYFGFLFVIAVVLSPYFEWELVGVI